MGEKYLIVMANDAPRLAKDVNEAMESKSLIPLGGVAVTRETYGYQIWAQALCSADCLIPPGAAESIKKALAEVLPRKKPRKK
jgi:hypothetical protein